MSERKRLGLSQASLAERCGVSREQMGKYERGVNAPGGEFLFSFAELGGDVQYVLTGRSGGGLPLARVAKMAETAYAMALSANLKLEPRQFAQMLSALLGQQDESNLANDDSKRGSTGSGSRKAVVSSGGMAITGDGNIQIGGRTGPHRRL